MSRPNSFHAQGSPPNLLVQFSKNLPEDPDLVHHAARAWLQAFIHAIPSGKQNSMAAHNPPSLILAVVRRHGVWNLANAFAKPVFPLFLGRKAFAAPPDLFLGLTDLPATEAIRKHPWLERRAQALRKARHDAESGKPQMLRISCDSEPSPSAHLRHDHPVSFAWGNRQFAPRYVRTDFVPLTLDLLPNLKEQACT